MSLWGWFWIFMVTFAVVLLIIGFWKVFTKANYPGWWSLIPILNIYGWVKIANRAWWWMIFFLIPIPIVPLVANIIVGLDVAKLFGRGTLFGIGLALFPYIWSLFLGFGPEEYRGIPRGGDAPAEATAF